MTFRKSSHRWALWAFAAALLLKSAMPWLASVSAEMQGKALVEVCTVYGVSLKPLGGGDASQPAHEPTVDHSDEQCALTAFAAMATSGSLPATPAVSHSRDASPQVAYASSQAPDAMGTWAARLRHGPPSFS
jgi:hypothetical protein